VFAVMEDGVPRGGVPPRKLAVTVAAWLTDG